MAATRPTVSGAKPETGHYDEFLANPQAEQYQQAIVEADRIRHAKVQAALAAQKKQIDLTRQWKRPLLAQIPVTFTLVVLRWCRSVAWRWVLDRIGFGNEPPV